MNNQYEDALDAFLLEKMTQAEKENFLTEVKDDEKLSKELALRQELFDGITAIGDKNKWNEIAAIKVNEDECIPYLEETQSYKIAKNRTIFRYLVVAASVIFLASISFIFLNQTENKYGTLADQFYIQYTEQDRGLPGETNSQTDKPEKLLLSGIEYYDQEKHKQAIHQFEALIAQNNLLYLVDAKWYASLSYLKIAKPGKAKILLQEILNDEHAGKTNKEKAKNVLSEIDKIQVGK